MTEVELLLRGPVGADGGEGAKTRKVWRFRDITYPEKIPDKILHEVRADTFHAKLWERILDHMNILGINHVYSITITGIQDITQIYP